MSEKNETQVTGERLSEITRLHNRLCGDARKLGIDLGGAEWSHLGLYEAIAKESDRQLASAVEVIRKIAKPALGGKEQQYRAQVWLKENGYE